MTLDEAADKLERVAAALPGAVLRAERDSLAQAYKLAVFYSSGPLTVKILRKLDHPYARRHSRPRLNPRVVNVQSGRFRARWIADGPKLSGGDLVSALYNLDPKAELLESGTMAMFARRPLELVAKDLAGPRAARLAAAIGAAFRA